MQMTEQPGTAMLLTVSELVHETGLARSYIYRLIDRGDLPCVRIGRAVRVRRVDLEQFIEERLEGGDDA